MLPVYFICSDSVFPAASDGKSYDAYVSFLQSDNLSLDKAATFALQILPEELEQKHGYSLYIRGRDDCPGEGQEQTLVISQAICNKGRKKDSIKKE